MVVKQCDIVLVGLDPTVGAEMNAPLRTVQIAPLTTNTRGYPWRVPITFQRTKEMVALGQICTIDKRRVIKRLGKIRPSVVTTIKMVIDEMLVR